MREKYIAKSVKHNVIVEAQVVPESARCVQCGICSYNCPIGIDVRRHAWQDEPITDSHCITCGECVARCPRSVLRFEKSVIFKTTDEIANKSIHLHDFPAGEYD